MNKLMVLTPNELATYIVEQLDMKRVLLKPFPACDFGVIELDTNEERTKLTTEELASIHSEVIGWYGLKQIQTGFDDAFDLSIVADYYGGGCTTFFQLKNDMSHEEAKNIVFEALKSCVGQNECVDSETLLIVERLEV